jgi:hypothetical protein
MTNRTTLATCMFAATLATVPVTNPSLGAEATEDELLLVSGILLKLDLPNNRGLMTTDLGRPVYFEVPKAYLFENVIIGARISLRLDEDGRAIKVMDTSIPDVMVTPDVQGTDLPKITTVDERLDR